MYFYKPTQYYISVFFSFIFAIEWYFYDSKWFSKNVPPIITFH